VPCGIEEFGVTSLARLGRSVEPDEWDRALLSHADTLLAASHRPCACEPAA